MALEPIRVVSVCGSLRLGSYNRIVANALPGLAPPGMEIVATPPFDAFPLYNADLQQERGFPEVVQTFAEAIRTADGVVLVTPEYNYSVPGGLKNALDWISRMEARPLANKPVAIQSAATGQVGGARMQHHLRQIFVFMEAVTFTRPEVAISFAKDKVDEASGTLTDEVTRNVIRSQLAAFAPFVRRIAR